jgi:hypothetical protein
MLMGISKETIKLLVKVLDGKHLYGDVITYGVQGVEITYHELIKVLEKRNVKYRNLDNKEIRRDAKTQYGNTLAQDTFFKTLGCDRVDSIDLHDAEDPSVLLDLNEPVPESMRGQYDVVWDGGTMEHCLNVKEVLFNCARLLRKGGMVVHNNPVSGWINHGFYQFCPSLYFDFYLRNGFGEAEMMIQFGSRYFEYASDLMGADLLNQAGLILFFATKKRDVEEIIVPNQSYYHQPCTKGWDDAKVEEENNDKTAHNKANDVGESTEQNLAGKRTADFWCKMKLLTYVLKEYKFFRGIVDRHQELMRNSREI